MSIAQNVKLLNKPINELAMLSQETIMQMAQTGQLPVQYVAPILEVKAQQAQTGAEIAAMAAQANAPVGTVLENLLAQNAANEAKAAMPEMQMPEDSGIAALPVDEGMVPEYAGGGIVAFEAGGDVDYSQFGEYGEELKRQEALRRLYMGENEALKAEREGMAAAAKEQRAMRLLEAGLGIMGGESPYALTNIGKGSQAALRGYGEDVAAQRKRKAELAGVERAEKGKVLESAMGEVRAREKNTPEAIRGAREIQNAAKKAGKKVPTLEEALQKYSNLSTKAPGTTTLEAAYVRSKAAAAAAVGELVNSSVFNSEVRSIEKKQGKAAADEYKRRRIAETVALYPGVDPASVMASIGGGKAPSGTSSGTVDKNNPLLR